MNANLPDDHSSVYYYDGDYPGQAISPFPENFDPATLDQGIAYDVDRYQELADESRGDRCSSSAAAPAGWRSRWRAADSA